MTQPITQPFDSQDDYSQYYYSVMEPTSPPLYTLTALYTRNNQPKIQYDLDERYNRWTVGREELNSYKPAMNEQYFHVEEFLDRRTYLRFSRKHFAIERLTFEDNAVMDQKQFMYIPAVITVLSASGLTVNDEKLVQGETRILQHNDVIKLDRRIALFRFRYRNIIDIGLQHPDFASKYFVGDSIGSGGYGNVHIVYAVTTEASVRDMQKFAMKVISFGSGSSQDPNFYQKVKKEALIMKDFTHVNVLQLVEYFPFQDKVIMILPMMWGGDLLHRIQNAPNRRLNEGDTKFFMLQLLKGLEYLHDLDIAHRDIKCDNILLYDFSHSPLLKISDFGLSKVLEEKNTICGTKNYSAPEILSNNQKYTHKVDIWSAGVVCYAMISGTFPFHEHNSKTLTVTEQIMGGYYRFPSQFFDASKVSPNIITFIRSMLQVKPKNRATIETLLNHVWMRCPIVNKRLDETYAEFGIDETLTDEQITQNLNNVTIGESPPAIHVAKRPRIG